MSTERLNEWLNQYALYIALAVAWIATLGSLYFSEVLRYVPCQLCWYQRIFMYPMAGLLALGLLRFDKNLPHLVIPFTVIGGAISTYHYLLQKTDLFDSAATCQVGAPCNTAWINWFGFVTIPLLALFAFFLITVFSLIAIFAEEPARREGQSMPWLQVSGTIAVIVAVFIVMALARDDPKQALAMPEISVAGTSALSSSAQNNSTVSQSDELEHDVDLQAGQALYNEGCAVCHGANAAGIVGLGPSLLSSEIFRLSDAEVLTFIRNGVDLADPHNSTGLVMPASGGRSDLSDDDIQAIIDYVRSLSENP